MDTPTTEHTDVSSKKVQMGVFRQLWVVVGTSVIMATLFTMWTSRTVFSENLIETIAQSLAPRSDPEALVDLPTPTQRPRPHIGIVAGHWGSENATWAMGDFDSDSVVGPSDAAILAAHWHYEIPVPEPATAGQLLLGLLSALELAARQSRRSRR